MISHVRAVKRPASRPHFFVTSSTFLTFDFSSPIVSTMRSAGDLFRNDMPLLPALLDGNIGTAGNAKALACMGQAARHNTIARGIVAIVRPDTVQEEEGKEDKKPANSMTVRTIEQQNGGW